MRIKWPTVIVLAFAASPVQSAGHADPSPPAVIEARPVAGVLSTPDRTILGVIVGRDSLTDVTRKLGRASIVKKGDADGRPRVLCYRSGQKGDETTVIFEAGPLGGFMTVTGVTIARASDFSALGDNCRETSKVTRVTARTAHVRLDMPIGAAVRALKATPSTSRDGLVEMAFERTVTKRSKATGKEQQIDVSSGIVVRPENNNVRWFAIYYTESL